MGVGTKGVLIVLEWFATNPFFYFWGEKKPILAACSDVAHWSMCQVHKRSPGRTGQPREGQALRSVLFVSRTPRGRCVQCHQLAADEITISATRRVCPLACVFASLVAHWKGGVFPNTLLLVDNLRCMGFSLPKGWSSSLPHRKSSGTKTLPRSWPDLAISSTWGQSCAQSSPFNFTRSLGWHLYPLAPDKAVGQGS